MNSLLEKQMNFNKKVKINFEGGDLTSDSGLLLYKEFDNKIGFSNLIKDTFILEDDINTRTHTNEDIVLQKIYQNIAGYHTDDNADELTLDPTLTTILNKEKLASQPTISRFNNRLTDKTLKQQQFINEKLLDRAYSIEPIEHIIFDIDSTNLQTFGKQHGAAFNYHYGSNGYHPLLMFNGLNGDLIKAELRSGNVYTSRKVVSFIGPVLKKYLKEYPSVTRCIRGDSGFAVPGLYELAEQLETLYAIRLKANATLYKLASKFENKLIEKYKENPYDYQVIYEEFQYKASSWDKNRRVAVKIEKPEGQIGYHYTFVVTNMTVSPKNIINFYCNRGTMENFIKEGKNGFAFGKMSSRKYLANANKLQEMVLAYNLNNLFRRLCFSNNIKENRIETIRMKIIKVAAKVIKTGRYLKFKLCSSCAYKKDFWYILDKINELPCFT